MIDQPRPSSKNKSYQKNIAKSKHSYKYDMNKTLNDAMHAIQTDNNNLRRVLNLATENANLSSSMPFLSPTSIITSQKNDNDLNRINEQIDIYHQKIKNEQIAIKKLHNRISKAQIQILEERKISGSKNKSYTNSAAAVKHVSIVEKRLNQSLVKYNQKVAQNKQLRNRIDYFKQERVVFDGIYKKLERELCEKARQMSIVIEQGENASIERDRIQSEFISTTRKLETEIKST